MAEATIAQLIAGSRRGETEQLSQLLGLYANYLRLVASSHFDRSIRRRFSESDVVQETLLAAHQSFRQFRGETEGEFLAWLRQILVHQLANLRDKHLRAQRRDLRREISLQQLVAATDRSTMRLERLLGSDSLAPDKAAEHNERLLKLTNALGALPPDYREVLVLRHLQDLPFPEVAARMERSHGAVRMLWLRAFEQLKQLLAATDSLP